MTADPGLASDRRVPHVITTLRATSGWMTARECGLGATEDAPSGMSCRDFLPELIVELI